MEQGKQQIAIQNEGKNSTVSVLNALEKQDKLSLSTELRRFKQQNGAINFVEVLKIPFTERIVTLVEKEGLERIHSALVVAIELSMESMNLAKPLSANQIYDLVDAIIDSSGEDFLGLQDVVLFLQKMVRGEPGALFSSMDIPKFMQMFEKYRQERHSEYMRIKEEKEAQLKATPLGNGRLSEGMKKTSKEDAETFFDLMQTYNEEKHDNGKEEA